jgi:DNA-binding transcriptional LysR family regulator
MQISDFSLRNMRTFCAVVENQGFSGAQAVLGMSQPAISTHIKDLEESLGFRICQRGRGGFVLTDKGQIVYEKSKKILSNFENYKAELGELRKVLTGTLNFGFADNVISDKQFPLQKIISTYLERDQDVEIKVVVGSPDSQEKDLLNNSLHLAIGPFRNFLSQLSYDHIYDEKHSLYCGLSHPLFDKPKNHINFADITDSHLVIRSYLGLLELNEIGPINATAQVSNMEAAAFMILSGKFIGYLPDHFAEHWVKSGEMRAIDHLGLERISRFYMVTRQSPQPPKFVRAFMNDIKSTIQSNKNS